jgi:hypothetical protein
MLSPQNSYPGQISSESHGMEKSFHTNKNQTEQEQLHLFQINYALSQ